MKPLSFQIVFLGASWASDAIERLFLLDTTYRGGEHAMVRNILFSGADFRF